MNYYNENDPRKVAWLGELIRRKLIPAGDVDPRSILEVQSDDLRGYRQCHFFAGIGGWSYALSIIGWPEDRQVWTASCPCQPFSQTGKGLGESDERHLWPHVRFLLSEHRPAKFAGEQVASPLGRQWFSRVRSDLEALDYQVGAADMCAASIGAPHNRPRLFFMGHTNRPRSQGRRERRNGGGKWPLRPPSVGLYDCFQEITCEPGIKRRIEPGSFPLANGVPARVGRISGYGNAINPTLAAEFVYAFEQATSDKAAKS